MNYSHVCPKLFSANILVRFFLRRVNIYLSAGGGLIPSVSSECRIFASFVSASTHIKISCSSKHENYDSLLPGRPISPFPFHFSALLCKAYQPFKKCICRLFYIFGMHYSKGMGTKLFNTIILSKKV